jgi:hypothetical protein
LWVVFIFDLVIVEQVFGGGYDGIWLMGELETMFIERKI